MVDFRKEDAHLYIPKNLSFEKGSYKRYYEESLYLQALCDIRKDSPCISQRVAIIDYLLSDNSNRDIRGNKLAARKNNSYSSPAAITSILTHEKQTDFLVALDLAFSSSSKSNKLFTKSNPSKWTKMEDIVSLEKDKKGYNDKCCTDLETLSKDLKLFAERPQSPTTLSETDTDYSEDYMRMTDIASQGSDSPGIRTTPFGSTSSYDSTMSFNDKSSVCTLENDDDELERVTLNFSNRMDLTPDDDFLKPMKMLENHVSVVQNDSQESKDVNTEYRSKLVKRRIQEKELPKIKLLLSQSPPTTEMFDKDMEELGIGSPLPNENTPGSSGSIFVNQEFDFLETEQVKRSISLKTYKTPPGTPHRKKVVRFADAMGLDLEDVKHVMNMDDPPNIPESAMKDLKVGLEEEHKTEGTKYLRACFPQPCANPNFVQLVTDAKIKLENCVVDDQDMTVSGTIRVANIAFHKRVILRYSVNNWLTFTDVFACYVQNSNDGATDRFSFTFNVPNYFQSGNKLHFAVMFEANGQQYWDNNGGSNYVIECYATAVPITEGDNLWMHFL